MPIYDYECPNCGTVENIIAKMDDNTLVHDKCQGRMRRLISGSFYINMGPVGAYGYHDETLGKYISTNKQWREEMRKQGVTPKGDTPKVS